MANVITYDNRLTVFGDRVVLTGTYDSGTTAIDFSDFLSEVDAVTLTPTAAPGAADSFHINAAGTGITLPGAGATANGQFLAIGRRS